MNTVSSSYRPDHKHVVLIGGTGHVGSYLVPRLVAADYRVTVVSRGNRPPYFPHAAWSSVTVVHLDRAAEEKKGEFGKKIAEMQPDIVIDMICFDVPSCRQLVEALTGKIQLFIHCGTIWVHGPSEEVPTREEDARRPFGEYGIKKAEVEDYLLNQARRHSTTSVPFPATIIHPGHIVGKGWLPLNPQGNFSAEVYRKLAQGQELLLPNFGMETVHHVHADDVAGAFIAALARPAICVGESFHIVSPAAITLRAFAQAIARFYGQQAKLKFVAWEEFKTAVSAAEAEGTFDHIAHSPNCSIQKIQRLLQFSPRYSSIQAVTESIEYYFKYIDSSKETAASTSSAQEDPYAYLQKS
jgi:nucleoside-diphosphate-sugar epimerase